MALIGTLVYFAAPGVLSEILPPLRDPNETITLGEDLVDWEIPTDITGCNVELLSVRGRSWICPGENETFIGSVIHKDKDVKDKTNTLIRTTASLGFAFAGRDGYQVDRPVPGTITLIEPQQNLFAFTIENKETAEIMFVVINGEQSLVKSELLWKAAFGTDFPAQYREKLEGTAPDEEMNPMPEFTHKMRERLA
ncbi:hypothetical protein CCASP_00350 [Corynebacterium caspium DSM 44850]|nr:hypothetical protein CCASP_00350 [Corynebacterium caspium DSM 44850]